MIESAQCAKVRIHFTPQPLYDGLFGALFVSSVTRKDVCPLRTKTGELMAVTTRRCLAGAPTCQRPVTPDIAWLVPASLTLMMGTEFNDIFPLFNI